MILDRIVAAKRQEVAAARATRPLVSLGGQQASPSGKTPTRGFARALRGAAVSVIAEIKRASPSRGILRADFDPPAIAASYARCGAAAISVLTDEPFFGGSLDHLRAARRTVDLPLLRKDFVIDPYQVYEAAAAGADAVLLIVAILPPRELAALLALAAELDLDALVEVHTQEELEIALAAGARLVGINNRDLRTSHTTVDTTFELLPAVPPHVTVVSESGIFTRRDVERLAQAGVDAVLVGESLMRSPDVGEKLQELVGVPVQDRRGAPAGEARA